MSLHSRHAEQAPAIRTTHAVRLGFRQIKGFRAADAARLTAARGRPFTSVRDVWLRSGISRAGLERLAEADAFRSLGLDRRAALWEVRGLDPAAAAERLPLSPPPPPILARLLRPLPAWTALMTRQAFSAASRPSSCPRCRSASMW